MVSSHMARVAALSDCAIGVRCAVCVNSVGAVVLLVRLAVGASEVGTNLSTNTSTVADLEVLDLGADLDDLANDLVSYAERQRNVLAPSASDCVDVRSADTAGIDGDINIVFLEFLEGKLAEALEVGSSIKQLWIFQLPLCARKCSTS